MDFNSNQFLRESRILLLFDLYSILFHEFDQTCLEKFRQDFVQEILQRFLGKSQLFFAWIFSGIYQSSQTCKGSLAEGSK